jgi:very-short-patch-repair endonuclease
MTPIYILIAIIVVIGVVAGLLKEKFDTEDEKPKYDYKRRNWFLTKAEHEFYKALVQAVGQDYIIFAQVHLPTLLDEKVIGQNWKAAFRHISQKSVDFVLCDKAYISPKLAIELDDKSHDRPDRQDRDIEVERILKGAGMPLLRIQNHGTFNPQDLAQKIRTTLNPSDTSPSPSQSVS